MLEELLLLPESELLPLMVVLPLLPFFLYTELLQDIAVEDSVRHL